MVLRLPIPSQNDDGIVLLTKYEWQISLKKVDIGIKKKQDAGRSLTTW